LNDKEEIKFAPVPLSKLHPNEELCSDIYLRINEKYIKYKNEGEILPSEKYNLFLNKDVKEIYISISDVQKFMDWMVGLKERAVNIIVDDIGEEHRHLVEAREEISEIVYEVFADKEMDSALVEHLKNNIESFINKAQATKESKMIIAKLVKHNNSLADHSVNVANIAIYLAMALGHGHQFVLENIYLGALLHDYGKAKIPANVLENPGTHLYSQAIQFHPIKGAKVARQMDNIKDQVATIVEQHHEQYDGKGFPNNLKGEEIYDLSQIVALANRFDNLCDENAKKSEIEKFRASIKAIEYDRGKLFNPDLIKRSVTALKLSYGGYEK